MPSRRRPVSQLADEAGLDIDEALVALWDAGFDEVISPNDRLGPQQLNRARRALGMATRRELKAFAYWVNLLSIQEPELRALLCKRGVPSAATSQKLQRKGISRLKAEARKQGIDPITGTLAPSTFAGKATKPPAFKWRTIGHKRELSWLSVDQVRAIHFELVRDFLSRPDPIAPPGVQSEPLLASAVFRPQTALGDTLKYPTVEMSAAALLHSIIQDHPFHNGNKRTALVSTLVFLDENGLFPHFNQDEAFKLVLQVAQHQIAAPHPQDLSDREVLSVADWLCDHCRVLEKGDRPIPFRKLRRILGEYACTFSPPSANKITITRTIKKQRFIPMLKKQKTLHTQVFYYNEGQDVAQKTIKQIRKHLRLDDYSGIDSRAFYSKHPMMAKDFIAYYRKTLNRLAKF